MPAPCLHDATFVSGGPSAAVRHRDRRAKGSLVLCLLAFAALGGCRRDMAVIDPAMRASARDAATDATIRGTVRAPDGTRRADGRGVEVINVATGERQRARTNTSGDFTFRVKPGTYRVELEVRDGEAIIAQPGTIDVHRSEPDGQADFVLRTVRVSRPRAPAHRVLDGLGSPIA